MTLPSPWRKTSFTRPYARREPAVRVPLPNGKPGCMSFEETTSARYVPACTFTFWNPMIFDEPLTP